MQLGEENILCTFCVVCGAVQFVSGGWQVNDTDKKETNANTQIGRLSMNFWPAILSLLSDLSILPFDQAFSFEFEVLCAPIQNCISLHDWCCFSS